MFQSFDNRGNYLTKQQKQKSLSKLQKQDALPNAFNADSINVMFNYSLVKSNEELEDRLNEMIQCHVAAEKDAKKELIRKQLTLLNAIIPSSTEKVFKTLNINKKDITINQINRLDTFDHNKELKELDILFNKIENDN